MSLDEKNTCTIEANKKRLLTLKKLDDTAIGTTLVLYEHRRTIVSDMP